MDTVKIYPAKLNGEINIPPSKSLSHRAVICAALAKGESVIDNLVLSDDIKATLDGMKSFGADIEYINNDAARDACSIRIKGSPGLTVQRNRIHCSESGSTLRFLVPLAALAGEKITFTGKGKLVERPLDIYYEIFEGQNIKYCSNSGRLPLTVNGMLKPGTFRVSGDVSSQFITGLMFALPLLDGNSRIEVTTEPESKGYVELTMHVLDKFGIQIVNNGFREFVIGGNQEYQSADCRIEGDYSQAAFWIAAGILGGGIKCKGLNLNSVQGDRVIMDITGKMGVSLETGESTDGRQAGQGFIKVYEAVTRGIEIDASQCPDLVPVLAVLGAISAGTTKIINAKRLRIKESDRLRAISTELNKLGAGVTELDDGLIIEGKEKLTGGRVDSWNDHRIAMALAVASIKCTGPVILTGSDAVKKSYPHFWRDFKSLGGKTDNPSAAVSSD